MNSNDEILERLVALETEKKSQDREIKEIKGKVDNLSTLFNSQALSMQSIQSDVSYLRKEFTPIVQFIEDLKTQPKKELNKFMWVIITAVLTGTITTGITLYITHLFK